MCRNIHRIIPDAGRLAPISVRASSSTKRQTKCYHQTQALMGATRLASGIFLAVSSSVGSFSNLVLHGRL